MAVKNPKSYQNLDISGIITIKRTKQRDLKLLSQQLFILGPTGAGKSTFIEALAQDPALQISSGQLEGFTQSVSAYEVQNVTCRTENIHLVDVPGFADTNISGMRIVTMLKDWISKRSHGMYGMHGQSWILYLTPIDVVRLPGSHREVLRTFQALTGVNSAKRITIVTTMWDSIWSDTSRERAEKNFNELRDVIWKDFVDMGSEIVRFDNTQDSALTILDTALGNRADATFHLDTFASSYTGQNDELIPGTRVYTSRTPRLMRNTPFSVHIYDDLQNRMQNLRLKQAHIQSEMEQASTESDDELTTLLSSQLEETQRYLAQLEVELHDFGPPPLAPGTAEDPDPQRMELSSPFIGPTSPISYNPPRSRGRFIQVMSAMKCWGRTVGERYYDN